MDRPYREGCAWYVGAPGCGKSYLAAQHLRQWVQYDRYPALVIDSVGDQHVQELVEATSVEQAVDVVWKERRSCRYVPKDDPAGEVDRLARACLDGHAVHLFVDESAFYLDSRRGAGGALIRLLRSYRHADVTIQCTTQSMSGDVSQVALACAPRLFVFRSVSPRTLQVLQDHFGLDPERVRNLPNREFIPYPSGESQGKTPPPPTPLPTP